MSIKQNSPVQDGRRQQRFAAATGLAGALAASSCCILPLALFSLGVSGAWIGTFTRLAPYQPWFLTVAAVSLGYGYWLTYRSGQVACADGAACARRLSNSIVHSALVAATVLFIAALGFDFIAPLFLDF